LAFNLPELEGKLNLSSESSPGSTSARSRKWNDASPRRENPGVTLPNKDIHLGSSLDGSGTTNIFTNYLPRSARPGISKLAGHRRQLAERPGGQGNAGVAARSRRRCNAIGYVELAYAVQNNLPSLPSKMPPASGSPASLRLHHRRLHGVTLPDDMKVMVTNSSNPAAYRSSGSPGSW